MPRALCILPLIAACLILSTGAQSEPADAVVAELRAEIARLQTRVAELEAENAELRGEVVGLESTREDLVAEKQQLEKLAGVTTEGDRVESMDAVIQTRYNAQANRTSALSKPRRIETGAALFGVPHYLAFAFDHPGQMPAEPVESVRLLIYTKGNSNKRYGNADSVDVEIDGETIDLPVTGYEILKTKRPGASVAGTRSYDEKITIAVDAATLDRIAQADRVELMLNETRVPWNRDTIALAGAVAARVAVKP